MSLRTTVFSALFTILLSSATYAQSNLFCGVTATPVAVRSEGIAEKMGDIILSCSGGTPGFVVTGNLGVSLTVPITNRLTPGTATDVIVTVDSGSGPVPVPFNAVLTSFSTVSLNGISFTTPPSGKVTIGISNLRGSAASAQNAPTIQALIALNGLSTLSLLNNQLVVAVRQRGILANSSTAVIRCVGSPLPSTINVANFFAAGTHFESTRFTEGFASSFQPKGPQESAGTRFLVSYTTIPAGVMFWVPDLIAGSDALQPTGGGDLGTPQAAGQYQPGSQTLLLARVQGADSTGNGGTPVYAPPPGGPAIALNSATQLPVTGSTAYVVYEVMDANPTVLENAQFPLFVGLASTGVAAGSAQQTMSFAPVSTDFTANSSAPIPRFIAAQPPSDCQVVGDCSAAYFPSLVVHAQPIAFTAYAGGAANQGPGYIAVDNGNASTSVLNWTASVTYQSGSNWIQLEVAGGLNNGSVRVFPQPQKLAPGTYNATVTIDGGAAGTHTIPVSLVVLPAPTTPTPTPTPTPTGPVPGITAITNGANFLAGPVVSGSLATIKGTNLNGNKVSVTFNGIVAKILYTSATQINLIVPDGLGSGNSAQVAVTIDGVATPAATVPVATVAPAIFSNGILNQDYTPNTATNGAAAGSVAQIFLTGLPESTGTVLVKIHDRADLVPLYAGPAPGLTGVQQVDVAIPADLPAMTTTTLVCGMDASGTKVCSAAQPITLADAAQ